MNLVHTVFKDEITQEGLNQLREKYPSDLVMDMQDDGEFKKARKIRTERNKLIKAINDKRLQHVGSVKEYSDSLIEEVSVIYSNVVDAFELEDKRRKELEAEKKRQHEEMLSQQRMQINSLRDFINQAEGKTSEEISDILEAVDLIETDCFHKDLIHEAIETKKQVVSHLSQLWSTAKANEKLAAEREQLRAQQEEVERLKVELEAKNKEAAQARELPPGALLREINPLPEAKASEEDWGDLGKSKAQVTINPGCTLTEYQKGYLQCLSDYSALIEESGKKLDEAVNEFLQEQAA